MHHPHPLQALYRLTRSARLTRLVETGYLSPEQQTLLQQTVCTAIAAKTDILIENTIGCFPLPLGLATHIIIDDTEHIVPMAIEETSVIAALSHIGKWSGQRGKLTTTQSKRQISGHIHFPKLKHPERFQHSIHGHHRSWIEQCNRKLAASMVQRGGGVVGIHSKVLTKQDGIASMGVVTVTLNPCDSMGANLITQICEQLKPLIATTIHETAGMAIVSNHAPENLTTATLRLHDIPQELAQNIVTASEFAEMDVYRAVTHNKGILNAIDAVLIATGNDWRAVESGLHAYACQQGSYRPLSQWTLEEGTLIGTFSAPIHAATVGGATSTHPLALLCLELLNLRDANHLSRLLAGVGLLQNLAALKALVTDGLVKGHMRLHLGNLLAMTDATSAEKEILSPQLSQQLDQHQKMGFTEVQNALSALRKQQNESCE